MSKKRDEPVTAKLEPGKQNCATCRFWLEGICRFFPPTPIYRAALDGSISSRREDLWPATKHDDLCGQWVERT